MFIIAEVICGRRLSPAGVDETFASVCGRGKCLDVFSSRVSAEDGCVCVCVCMFLCVRDNFSHYRLCFLVARFAAMLRCFQAGAAW